MAWEKYVYIQYISQEFGKKKPNTPNPITHFSGVLSFRVWGFGVFGFFSQITCDILQSPEIF